MGRPRVTEEGEPDGRFRRKGTNGRKRVEDFPTERPEIDKWKHLPFKEWAERFLKVRNLEGELVPFVLNPVQEKLDEEWERQIVERGYVKMRVLKARKMGASTWAQGKMFRAVVEREGWHAGVLAHDDTGCDFVFDRTKVYAESLPDEFKRRMVRNNKKEIAYEEPHGSFLRVNVAKGRGAWGSGGDIHMLHFSERSKWQRIRGSSKAQGQATAVLNAMPKSVVGRAVVDESTANGKANEFYQAWCDALPPGGRSAQRWGRDGFVAVFFAWFDFPDYRIKGAKLRDYHVDKEWEADESRLRKMGCDDEQLAWRRRTIAEECQADLDTFYQEYPSTAEEAFLATGRPVFQSSLVNDRLIMLEKREKTATEEGNPPKRWAIDTRMSLVYEDKYGDLRLWHTKTHEELKKDDPERLVIVADPAGAGTTAPDQQKGDPACAYVWDRQYNEQIAELHGYWTPDEFANQLNSLGRMYGSPLLIVEAGSWGGHVLSQLQRLEYPRLYFRQMLGENEQTTRTDFSRFGWLTTAKTKPQMIDALIQLWRLEGGNRLKVNSKECCLEHLTFVKNGTKREAQTGCHDDRVMCCAIYAMWALENPYTPKVERTAPKRRTWADWMAEPGGGGADKDGRRATLWRM